MCNSKGITPIIQLSFSHYYWLQGATNATTAVNNATAAISSLVTTLSGSPYNVKYYSIGNEPDGYTGNPYNISTSFSITPATLNYYIKAYSDVIKAANPNAIVIGFDISFMQTNYLNGVIFGAGDITSTSTVTGKPYCDILAWHTYPYPGNQSRSDVISQPTAYFAADLTTVRNRLTSSAANPNNIKLAVTEMNVVHSNITATLNTIADQNCNSFLAGQWMAEMYAKALVPSSVGPVAFMIPWSLHESSGNAGKDDFGMINGTSTTTPQYRSTYYHTKMMAEGFNAGTFFMGSVNTNTNVKIFSVLDCSHLAIMIMNQESATAHTISINHAGTYPTNGTVNTKLNITPTPSWSNFTISIGARETILLIYDACHNLKKKYVYNETLNSSSYSAPTVTTYSAPLFCRCTKKAVSSFPNYTLRCADPEEEGGVHYNTVTLSETNTRIKDSAFITGALTVPNGKTLTIDTAEVTFGGGAKIVVESGGKVVITGSNLHGCAGSTWSGVEVSGNNVVSQFTLTTSRISGAEVTLEQTYSPSITENIFENSAVGIKLIGSKGFNINNNEFNNIGTCIKTASTVNEAASITENLFFQPDTAITFENDEHDFLDINCNGFVDYTSCGIFGTGCHMKDQGDEEYGAGNFFSSTSEEENHQLIFEDGESFTYYYDPAMPFELNSSSPYDATATESGHDRECDLIEGRLANYGIIKVKNQGTSSVTSDINKVANSRSQLLDCRPNPTSGKITFAYILIDNSAPAEIWIRNLFGETVSKFSLSSLTKSVEANLSNLSNGIYIYSLIINEKVVESKKLVISK